MNCPERERLEGYLLGTLDAGTNDAVDEHLDRCTVCLSAVETLEASANAVFSSLRNGPVRAAEFEGPAFRDLVEKVKSLGGPETSANQPIAAGTVLGSYVVGAPIAAGGMGRVHKAEHRLMKRVVALKVLPPELFRAPQARARFRREVQAAARLTSPNIVAAFDAGESDGRDYLVMEYVEGRTLAERVKADGPFDLCRALDCILQTARGLEHAHAAGIIHRDIKPANLILTGAGQVKILDMGLARIQQPEDGARDLTSAHVVMGTASYMAPEQAIDTRQADERADIYSLGCTLFFLLTGHPPYESETSMGTLLAHRERPIPSLRAMRPDCPAAVDALFRKLVAKDPAERPASATALRVDLERILQALGETRIVRKRWPSRRLVGAAALAACVLTFCVFAMRGVFPSPQEEEEKSTIRPSAGAKEHMPKGDPVAPLIDMALIKPGAFWIGASYTDRDASDNEKPRRQIKITQGFYLGKTEVTQKQFRLVMGNNPSIFSASGRFRRQVENKATDDYPVESVSWTDAIRFCNKLSEREG
ncbi:MAG TPA: protein kinase, partial [Gemmataceae bacterium]|nr:protein kinase [Gemmataceae bacterium]